MRNRMTWHRRTRQRVLDAQLANDELRSRLRCMPAPLAARAARVAGHLDALLPQLRALQLELGPYVDEDQQPPPLAA